MLKPLVSIVVVTHNRKTLLKECIIAILTQEYQNFTIHIIDNNSNDGTFEYIHDIMNDKISYYNTRDNIGGAGGFNVGIIKAMEDNPDLVLLMDDDCIVKKNTITKFINFANAINYDFGFLSSKVLWSDGSMCNMNIQKKTIFKSLKNYNNNQKIKVASFVSFLIRADVIKDVGLPIKDFFIWGDDIEYSTRISKKYSSYFVADSVVTHKSKANIGSNIVKDDIVNMWRYEYAYRNERYLYKKIGLKGKIYFLLKIIYHFFKIMLFADNKKIRLNVMLKAVKNGKKFNPKTEFLSMKFNYEQESKI